MNLLTGLLTGRVLLEGRKGNTFIYLHLQCLVPGCGDVGKGDDYKTNNFPVSFQNEFKTACQDEFKIVYIKSGEKKEEKERLEVGT